MYKKAAEQTGDFSQSALFNLGNAYYRAGNREKAIESYKGRWDIIVNKIGRKKLVSSGKM